jgi:hypothetical protein
MRKADEVRRRGDNPYPNDQRVGWTTAGAKQAAEGKGGEALAREEIRVDIAGRIVAARHFGKAAFLVVADRAPISGYDGHRGHRLGGRAPLPYPYGGADHRGGAFPPAHQVAQASPRKVARALRRGDPLPPAVRGPDRQRRGAGGIPAAQPDHHVPKGLSDIAGLPRGGDSDDAAGGGRSDRPAVRHAPQYPGHGPVPADRPRAVSQAASRGGSPCSNSTRRTRHSRTSWD